jgi:hypothetical protein
MKPLACEASPPPPLLRRPPRARLPVTRVSVFFPVSMRAMWFAYPAKPPANQAYAGYMARLIRMDGTGHTTLAEWSVEDDAAFEAAVREFTGQQELGYIGTVPEGPGKATHVRRLPRDADMVILRRPIAGG